MDIDIKLLQFDCQNALADVVGSLNGIEREELDEFAKKRGNKAARAIMNRRVDLKLAFADAVHDHESIGAAKSLAKRLAGRFDNLVIIGIGGSALGNTMLHSALLDPLHNLKTTEQRNGSPRWFVLDNVDPDWTSALLETLDLSKTLFVVTSKSGTTPEAIANFAIAYGRLRGAVAQSDVASHVVAITDPENGFLRRLAKDEGFKTLAIPPKLGGRFSVLSPVGLFPAALCGIGVESLLMGARRMLEGCYDRGVVTDSPAYLAALVYYLADTTKGKHINVLFPYSSRLAAFSDWFVQLWAESLGKAANRDGMTVNAGQTPLGAIGATDQHSQNQLFMEGPADKIITFVDVERFKQDCTIPDDFQNDPQVGYLAGHSLAKLLSAEKKGTELALKERKRPTCSIKLPVVDEATVGQLIMMFEMATAFAGELYNINAFDQPGVELGKKIAKDRLRR
ncbi:MAG TPA: glucose-6-phosphate isomerase [bacterium]|nr:glucose-6-phosphate isomerase [bacterium]